MATKKVTSIHVWLTGASTNTVLTANQAIVGKRGQLIISKDDLIITVIAKGQWVFFELVRG